MLIDKRKKKHDRHDEVVELYDRGLTQREIREKTGMGRQVRHILDDEKIERAAAPVSLSSISGNQQQKLESAKRRIYKELEKEFGAKLAKAAAEYRKQCDANVAEHKAKVDARAKLERENRDKERARYDMLSKVHSAKGLITSEQYKLIWKCLHPDTRQGGGVEEAELNEAWQLFRAPEVKALLVKEVAK